MAYFIFSLWKLTLFFNIWACYYYLDPVPFWSIRTTRALKIFCSFLQWTSKAALLYFHLPNYYISIFYSLSPHFIFTPTQTHIVSCLFILPNLEVGEGKRQPFIHFDVILFPRAAVPRNISRFTLNMFCFLSSASTGGNHSCQSNKIFANKICVL